MMNTVQSKLNAPVLCIASALLARAPRLLLLLPFRVLVVSQVSLLLLLLLLLWRRQLRRRMDALLGAAVAAG